MLTCCCIVGIDRFSVSTLDAGIDDAFEPISFD